MAPAVAARGASRAAAVSMSATPTVPADPHDVPVKVDMTAVTRNAARTIMLGLTSRIPQ